MMHVESGNYFGLNEVASFIWNEMDRPRTLAELCAAVQGEFDVDAARSEADALAFITGMIADGPAEVVPPTASDGERGA